MKLHSQEVRKLAPEMDSLKLGMGWTIEELDHLESSFAFFSRIVLEYKKV